MAIEEYDLVVVGGGPGGYVAAIRALQYGLKTAVVEEREMGGTCLNRGCIPTKALLRSAEVFRTVKECGSFGVSAQNAAFDYAAMFERKNRIVRQLRAGVEQLIKGNRGTVLYGKGRLLDKNNVEIEGASSRTVRGRHIILATGSMPSLPPIPGVDSSSVLVSDGVLSLKCCPERIVIIGGGVIGVEFASLYSALGKDVSIVEMTEGILPGTDEEISAMLRRSLEKKGVRVFTGAKVSSVRKGEKTACVFSSDGKEQTVEGDAVIVAAGRKPNTAGLGLENACIGTERGFIRTDERMETSVPGIYAVGDVTGRTALAHAASAQGTVAAANCAGKNARMDFSAIPGCVYTSPELAAVGLTEAGAVQKGYRVKVGRFPTCMNGKAKILGETEGMAKIVTDAQTGEILGAHIFAPGATDMIAEICAAMRLESTVYELANIVHPHPTVSEMIQEAANDAENLCINQPPKGIQK